MKSKTLALRSTLAIAATALLLPLAAQAQNIAIVNGKAVPKARVDALLERLPDMAATGSPKGSA